MPTDVVDGVRAMTDSSADATPTRRMGSRLRLVAGILLVIVSAAYLWRSLSGGIVQLRGFAYAIGIGEALLLLAGTTGTLLLSVAYHVLEVGRLQVHGQQPARVAMAYALGQIARYVPGKVVGVMFQVRLLTGRVRGSTIVMALLVQMLFDYAWTFAFAGILLASYFLNSGWPLLTLPLLMLALWHAHARLWCERLVLAVPFLRRFVDEPPSESYGRRAGLAITLVLMAEWLPMLLGMALGFGHELSFADGIVVGIAYLLAAVISLLVVVVPSGLVVREAAFVWIGVACGFPAPLLLFIGVVTRLALTAGELATALFCSLWSAATRSRSTAIGSTPP